MSLSKLLAVATAFLALSVDSALAADATPTVKFRDYEGSANVIYPEQIRTSFYLPMRDGVRLAVDLYRPAVGGKAVETKLPVVWHHTFDRQSSRSSTTGGLFSSQNLTKYGYVVAVVERRGLGASFGARRGYNDRVEAYDAYEVNEWLAVQPWSTGKVGVVGCSNTGAAAMHVITVRPPHLAAVLAGCFAWDTYDWTLRGGLFAQWGTGVSRTVEQDMQAAPVDGDESKTLLRQAAEEHQKSTPLEAMWKGMPYRDDFSPLTASRFWSEGSIASYADEMRQANVPLYIVGGWYDDLRRDGLITFSNWAADKRHIIIGPWLHCRDDGSVAGEMLRFFDFYLKGTPNGFDRDDPIHYYTFNAPAGKEWRAAKSWPLNDVQSASYYLGAKNALDTKAPAAKKSDTAFAVSYNVDCNPEGKAPLSPYSQPCAPRDAGPHFTTSPLKADVQMTGHPIADLWVSASTTDANIFVYLEDVAPDGKVTTISDGRLRAGIRSLHTPPYEMFGLPWHRAYREDAQALVPGTPAEMKLDLFPVSYVFKTGHRIQVTVTGADYRERNRIALSPPPEITVHHSKLMASSIALPIVSQ
jgi:uncharacterized protein